MFFWISFHVSLLLLHSLCSPLIPISFHSLPNTAPPPIQVTFPLFKKASVIGEDKQPLYAKLIELQPVTIKRDEIINKLKGSGIATTPEPEVAWNFEKFIINKDGTKVQRFSPGLAPNDADIVKTIEEFNQ